MCTHTYDLTGALPLGFAVREQPRRTSHCSLSFQVRPGTPDEKSVELSVALVPSEDAQALICFPSSVHTLVLPLLAVSLPRLIKGQRATLSAIKQTSDDACGPAAAGLFPSGRKS